MLFLIATNRWLSWDIGGIKFLAAVDTYAYQEIATFAPLLPPEHQLAFHHAQRFAVPYLVGIIAKATNTSVPSTFSVAIAICVFSIILLVHRCLLKLNLSPWNYILCIALLILNPYTFRYYLIARGILPDLVFVVGLTVTLLGLIEKRFLIVIVGIICAASGRQTAVVLIPGLSLWLVAGQQGKHHPINHKISKVLISVALTIIIYIVTGRIASSFAFPSHNAQHLSGLIAWFFSKDFTVTKAVEHILRIAIPVLIPLGIVFGICLAQRVQSRKFCYIPIEFWASLLMAAGIAVQPLLAGPEITGQNGSRLSALGFVPILISLAFLLKHQDLFAQLNHQFCWKLLFAAILIISSFHHLYTVIGPRSSIQFAVLQITSAIVAMTATYLVVRADS
jgi:hypothetical protein